MLPLPANGQPPYDTHPRPPKSPLLIAIAVAGGALFFIGVVAGLTLHQFLPSFTLRPAQQPTTLTVTQAPRLTLLYSQSFPRVAPWGNVATMEDDIYQRQGDGVIFIHAGRGSVTLFPNSSSPVQFGLRAAPGLKPLDIRLSGALINADAADRYSLTPEQRDQLATIGRMPQPSPTVRAEVETLAEAFLRADETTRPTAKAALLEAVRIDGQTRAPTIDAWHAERAAILTDEQRLLIAPEKLQPVRQAPPTTRPQIQ